MTATDKFLAEVKARAEKATPGPFFGRSEDVQFEKGTELFWVLYQGEENKGYAGKLPGAAFRCHSDTVLFQHARTDIERLVAMVEAARAALADCWHENCAEDVERRVNDALAELDRLAAGGQSG